MTAYAEVIVATLDGRRLFAEHVAGEAARELKIPTPAVHFFRHQRAPDGFPLRAWTDERVLAGEVRPGEAAVWVLANQSSAELAATVRHECHHLSWHARFGFGSVSPKEQAVMELLAERFALRETQPPHNAMENEQ